MLDHLIIKIQTSNVIFEERLRMRFPNLTVYDLRLCTYLNTGLSTKEIATILNITPDSVKKAKHRLRKKIRANPSEPIHDYFSH